MNAQSRTPLLFPHSEGYSNEPRQILLSAFPKKKIKIRGNETMERAEKGKKNVWACDTIRLTSTEQPFYIPLLSVGFFTWRLIIPDSVRTVTRCLAPQRGTVQNESQGQNSSPVARPKTMIPNRNHSSPSVSSQLAAGVWHPSYLLKSNLQAMDSCNRKAVPVSDMSVLPSSAQSPEAQPVGEASWVVPDNKLDALCV